MHWPQTSCFLIATYVKCLQFFLLFATACLWHSPFSFHKKKRTKNAQLEKISQKGNILWFGNIYMYSFPQIAIIFPSWEKHILMNEHDGWWIMEWISFGFRIIKSFGLEKTLEMKSNCKPDTTKSATKP